MEKRLRPCVETTQKNWLPHRKYIKGLRPEQQCTVERTDDFRPIEATTVKKAMMIVLLLLLLKKGIFFGLSLLSINPSLACFQLARSSTASPGARNVVVFYYSSNNTNTAERSNKNTQPKHQFERRAKDEPADRTSTTDVSKMARREQERLFNYEWFCTRIERHSINQSINLFEINFANENFNDGEVESNAQQKAVQVVSDWHENKIMMPPSPTNLPKPIKSRVLAAIRGAFVADAAAMGTHWIYNPQDMLSMVPTKEAPEFKDPPTPSYYSSHDFPGHYGPGMLSPYGEQMLFVTEYVAGGGSDVVNGPTMSKQFLEWAESFGGRPDSALKTFMENMKNSDGKWPNCGADDYQGMSSENSLQQQHNCKQERRKKTLVFSMQTFLFTTQ